MEKKALCSVIICVVLLTISLAGNLWFWTKIGNLESKITDLETYLETTVEAKNSEIETLGGEVDSLQSEKESLQTQVNSLQSEKESLQTEVDGLESEVSGLNSEISDLSSRLSNRERRVSELEGVDLDGLAAPSSWTGPFYTFEGTITNHGTENAYRVSVTIYLYENEETVFEKDFYVGDLAGREVELFEFSFTFYGTWDDWGWNHYQE